MCRSLVFPNLVFPNLAVVGEEFGTEDQAGAFYDAWWLTWQIVLMAGSLLAWGLVRPPVPRSLCSVRQIGLACVGCGAERSALARSGRRLRVTACNVIPSYV